MEVTRLVERALRDSRAVDLEALCVLAGQKVRSRSTHWQWSLLCPHSEPAQRCELSHVEADDSGSQA